MKKQRFNVTQFQILKYFRELQSKYPLLAQYEVTRSEEAKHRWYYYQMLDTELKMLFEARIPSDFFECLKALEFGLSLRVSTSIIIGQH